MLMDLEHEVITGVTARDPPEFYIDNTVRNQFYGHVWMCHSCIGAWAEDEISFVSFTIVSNHYVHPIIGAKIWCFAPNLKL
jgi:hypothetical protein